MPDYRRAWHPGGTWFFTVNLLQRAGNDLLVRHIEDLRTVVVRVRSAHPFAMHGWVVMPDHLHCLISLPENDTDFALRLRLIKGGFSKAIPASEWRSSVRERRGERSVWQRRYWEHLIRNEADFSAHMDYVHFNPVKHGLVQRAADWPHSTFRRLVERGVYPADWAGSPGADRVVHLD
jgi:putative transposase